MENLTLSDLAQLIGTLQLQLLDAQAKIKLLEKENADLKAPSVGMAADPPPLNESPSDS